MTENNCYSYPIDDLVAKIVPHSNYVVTLPVLEYQQSETLKKYLLESQSLQEVIDKLREAYNIEKDSIKKEILFFLSVKTQSYLNGLSPGVEDEVGNQHQDKDSQPRTTAPSTRRE
jgi:hypothetical protein